MENVKIGPLLDLPIYQIEDILFSENLTFDTAYGASIPCNICYNLTIVEHIVSPPNIIYLWSNLSGGEVSCDGRSLNIDRRG